MLKQKKSTSWQLKVFLAVLAVTLIACEAVMGIPEQAYPEAEPNAGLPAEAPGVNPAPIAVEQAESCFGGEVYHPEEALCYSEDGSAIPLFVTMMDGVDEYDENFEEELLDNEYTLVTYEIEGNEIVSPDYENVSADLTSYQDDAQRQEMVWDFYAAMIPPDARDLLTHYIVITDGLGGGLAAVEQSPDDPTDWMLNIDIADTADLQELTFTLIHEYGHLLTLNDEQVKIDAYLFHNPDDDDAYFEAEDACETYFPGEGCALRSSYLYQFYTQFWDDMYDEWLDIQFIEDDDEYYEALDEFYFAREDQFVTDYSVTNPEEDIAESWSFFIMKAKPTGNTIADQKVLFFYQFPELVSLREEIVARTYSRLIRMQ